MENIFLLTRQWRDTRDGIQLECWWASDQGPMCTLTQHQESLFFVERRCEAQVVSSLSSLKDWRMAGVDLKTFRGEPVNAVYFKQQRTQREAQQLLQRENLHFWEADVKPTERYLMERFITARAQVHLSAHHSNTKPIVINNPTLVPAKEKTWQPSLKMVSVDIETSMDAKQLFSIGVWCEGCQKVFLVADDSVASTTLTIETYPTQKACLIAFISFINQYDPDVLIGWNLIQFDLWVLETLCQQYQIPFSIGRGKQNTHWRQEEIEAGRRFVVIPGRMALDGIELLKAANTRFDSFSLQFVATQLLQKSKLLVGNHRGEDITRLYAEDPAALAEYNLRDCELVWDIFVQEKLLQFAMAKSQLTGQLLDRIGGSVAAFEYWYLPRLHRKGYVAPNLGELTSDLHSPGGYVMDSRPGIYDNVLVLDFKSLYPSIMRSFLIDPCAFWLAQHNQLTQDEFVEGFNGAYFAREGHILPQIIAELSAAREDAKRDKNAPLSHAIKILMNSFYGVLGSTGCRFFDPRVCSSITLRGHQIIQESRDWIEQQGYQVIYGDTDSLFVWLENNCQGHVSKNTEQCKKIGDRLAKELNQWWRKALLERYQLISYLEIQFETYYSRFLMPTMRGTDIGTKKRYAGIAVTPSGEELRFKGLENVRTDWTLLAKEFQESLYRKVFYGEDFTGYVKTTRELLLNGFCDEKLIYRKRLRRSLHEYTKTSPPHVQAARKLEDWGGVRLRRGDWIEYVITLNGPEPVLAQKSPLDYQHYVQKQLEPVADGILHFLNESMQRLVDKQLTLFDQ